MDVVTRTQLLNDTLPEMAQNLRMDVKYTNMNGADLSVEDIRQGTDFMAVITVGNTSGTTAYSNLALTHIIPSGWEIYNERFIASEAASADATGQSDARGNRNSGQPDIRDNRPFTYQDIRDDRILTYFDLQRGELKRFTVRLQATYAGRFVLPAIQCEAMYDASVQARTRAGQTTVSRD